ncbi:MAG: V-type ATPase 116kDa subunit family protein [Nitrososphaerales archaeon]
MGVSKISKVRITFLKEDIEEVVKQLFTFKEFHPTEEPPFSEDYRIIKLKSRAFELYSMLNRIIDGLKAEYDFEVYIEPKEKITLNPTNWTQLMDLIETKKNQIELKVSAGARLSERDLIALLALKEASLTVFDALRRIRVKQELRYGLTIEGFIPSKLGDKFKGEFSKWLHFVQPIRKDRWAPYVPTLLTNPKFIKLFENITLAQGMPKYREIDPTPFIAFIFPLFYGIMFPDLGQGLLLILFGKIISTKKKRKFKYWGKMLMTLGVSSSIVGVITGSFFGLEFGKTFWTLPSLRVFEDGTINTGVFIFILMATIIIGTYHLMSAYLLAFVNKLRAGKYIDAFTNHLATMVMYASSIPFALSLIGSGQRVENILTSTNPTPLFAQLGFDIPSSMIAMISLPLLSASILTVVFGRAITSLRHKDHKFSSELKQGITDVSFRSFEFFTNTLSYLRLGILLMMHSILMVLVNGAWTLGFLGLPLIVLGNILVIVLEGFVVYIQDLRLHYYEWFTKFYEGGGIPFTYLQRETQFVEIKFGDRKDQPEPIMVKAVS